MRLKLGVGPLTAFMLMLQVGCAGQLPVDATRPLAERIVVAGASHVVQSDAPGGGIRFNGQLGGRPFVLVVPANWTRETILFGQGYSTPGATPGVPEDPLSKDPSNGALSYAYEQGVAVGIVAFDKAGIGTESGVTNGLKLRDLISKLGGERFYMVGGSMGGNVVVAMIEQHPDAFVGAVSMCGVTEGWISQIGQMMEMRAAYNLLTEGTDYELPGEKDVTRSALPTIPPESDAADGQAFRNTQTMRIIMPIVRLFQAAGANPNGPEARIARQVAAIGGFAVDPAALAAPIYSAGLGMDDIVATMGGLPSGNVGKVYAPPDMSPAEVANFNDRIQRFQATPAAVVYASKWHEATGRFVIPLVTVHQRIDSLVPFSQSEAFGARVASAGNSHNLVQYAVPGTKMPVPGGLQGYTHCGFSPEQNIGAFKAMRSWVQTGIRPAWDAVQ